MNLDKLNIAEKVSNVKFSLSDVHSYITFLGIGVIIGFISRRYFRFLTSGLLVAILLIKALEYQHVLKIDWDLINSTLGFRADLSLESWALEIYAWAKSNIYLTAAGFIGFFIGYRAE